MASESDSETTPQPNDHGPDFLYGPRLVQGRNVFRLHLDQNDDNATRRQWSEEHKRAAYKLLANDPETLAAVERLRDLGDVTGWNTVAEKQMRFAEFAAGYIVGGGRSTTKRHEAAPQTSTAPYATPSSPSKRSPHGSSGRSPIGSPPRRQRCCSVTTISPLTSIQSERARS